MPITLTIIDRLLEDFNEGSISEFQLILEKKSIWNCQKLVIQ
jgi:hypothetical protein